jgi:hypothetical protein
MKVMGRLKLANAFGVLFEFQNDLRQWVTDL